MTPTLTPTTRAIRYAVLTDCHSGASLWRSYFTTTETKIEGAIASFKAASVTSYDDLCEILEWCELQLIKGTMTELPGYWAAAANRMLAALQA